MRGTAAGFLWVTDDANGDHELLESAGREFGMPPRFCRAAEVLELIRRARVDLVGVELGSEPQPGLALLRELHERLPRVTMLAASADHGVEVIRAALAANEPRLVHPLVSAGAGVWLSFVRLLQFSLA